MPMYSEKIIQQVWEMAQTVDGNNPNIWRKDIAGAWIRRDQYGMRNTYGWEIDHKRPRSLGGSDNVDNLLPLHWRNNNAKGDRYPTFVTCMSSDGIQNVEIRKSWKWKL